MRFWVIICPGLPANGMALFPLILIKDKAQQHDKVLINHEKIHLRQQLELLIVVFYVLYLANYLFNLLRYRNHYQAYFNISFEKEAYRFEKDVNYLNKRPFCNWLRKW
jgi:hypothetical protein